ncbi:MAG TPA: aminotransferase class IV [Gemmataceae bacterium]|nr:aminotransferase class IV [Gemmataceae bacterium]
MRALANLDGQMMPLENVKVSALDRGFLFGDSVYEVLRIYQGKSWLEEEHFQRLGRSLESIRIHGVDLVRMRRRGHETIAAGQYREAMLYIQITRGTSMPRRHAFPKQATPLELLWVEDYDDAGYAAGRRTGVGVITHPDLRWHRCGIKSTNLLANVLANQAAHEANCDEALLYLPDGTLTEASHSSFFWIQGGAVHTTPGRDNILPGITRALILRLADRAAITMRESHLRRDDLSKIEELFLTGTTSEVMPVIQIDGKPVGSGSPGPVTRKLQEVYTQAVKEFLE